MTRRRSLLVATLLAGCLVSPGGAAAPETAGGGGAPLPNRFFAFDNGLRDGKYPTPAARAKLLAELGYDGVGYSGLRGLEENLRELDARHLVMESVYTGVWIDGDRPGPDPALKQAVKTLAGRPTVIWLWVGSRQLRPSDPAGDARAIPILRKVAEVAASGGLRVALYPHYGNWVQSVQDAVRVAGAVDRDNFGVTFNLCHWLRLEGDRDLEARLGEALPHLFLVSINGADRAGRDWGSLIQPLDRGSFDARRVLRELRRLGYRGPIGLQCYNVRGPSRDHLGRSIAAWKRISREVGSEWIELIGEGGLSAWRPGAGDWLVASDIGSDPKDERRLAWKPGGGAIVNGPKGRTRNIFTLLEHGDVEAHVEFMVPKGSNSGVYFQGRYEIQILDSWGVKKPKHGDCGGIYQRWRDGKGFEGRPPRVNASRPPGQWQSFDVVFRAPRFDASGKKVRGAEFVRVEHNGVLVHEHELLSGPTRASAWNDEKPLGPLMLQGDHGPVAYRNIRLRPLAPPDGS